MSDREPVEARVNTCRFCAEVIQAAAVKCKHCGSWVDGSGGASNGIAAMLSFFIPGVGQMYRGKIGRGLAWMLLTIVGWFFGLLLVIAAPIAILVHILCVLDAASVGGRVPLRLAITLDLILIAGAALLFWAVVAQHAPRTSALPASLPPPEAPFVCGAGEGQRAG